MKRLVLAFTLAALSLGWALPAFAHAQLVDATPGIGSRVHSAPTSVTLSFDDDLIDLGSATANIIEVTNHSGAHFESGATRLSGATLSVNLQGLSAADTYTVTYSVVSADGHPIAASYQFEVVGDPGGSTVAPRPSRSSVPESTVSAIPIASAVPSASAVAGGELLVGDDNRGGGGAAGAAGSTAMWAVGLFALGAAVVGAGIAAVVVLRRRRAAGK